MSASSRWYGSASPTHASIAYAPDPVRTAGQHRASAGGRLAIRPTDFGPYRVVVLTLLVAALAVTAGANLTLRLRGPSARLDQAISAGSNTPPLVQAANAWVSTNLPHSAKFIADNTVRAALIDSGFPESAVTLPGHVAGCAAISFVVVTSTLESAAKSDPTLASCVRSALPIAVFGSGAAAVRVAETVPAGSQALASQRTSDTYDRTLAGTALVRNRSVQMSTAVATILQTGKLDLRAATVIAVLAGHTDVRVNAVLGDPAEVAAGLPARTTELVLTDDAELSTVLASLSEPFRPSAMVQTGSRSYRLSWPFVTAPIPGLN